MFSRTLILALWLAAFVGGLALDRPVARLSMEQGWEKPNKKRPERTADRPMKWTPATYTFTEVLKVPGEYLCTLAVAAAVWVFHRRHARAAALVAAAGALSGLNGLLKWVVGRRRPVTGVDPFDVDPFINGLSGLSGSDLAFPSGHACLAFATATALAILIPRWRWVFWAVAGVTALERIAENAHHVSDTVAGAGVGVLSAMAARALLERFWPPRIARSTGHVPEAPTPGAVPPGPILTTRTD